MKKRKEKKKKKMIITILLFFIMFIGIGYAFLFELLTIESTIKYDEMKWNVGFSTVLDGNGTVLSNPIISQDKKTITVTCNLGTSTSAETCIATAMIKNDSTFDIKLNEEPTITYESTYIESVNVVWTSDLATVKVNDEILKGQEKEVKLTITTKELTKDILLDGSLTVPVSLTMNWFEK